MFFFFFNKTKKENILFCFVFWTKQNTMTLKTTQNTVFLKKSEISDMKSEISDLKFREQNKTKHKIKNKNIVLFFL